MNIRIARDKETNRLVQILRKKGNQSRVRLLNRQKAIWVSDDNLEILQKPERGVHMRMTKPVKFDQNCGCTAVIEFRGTTIETFNVYGDMVKYLNSKMRKGLNTTPYRRRLFLKEKGFMRSKGMSHKIMGERRIKKIRQYERDGYRTLTATVGL